MELSQLNEKLVNFYNLPIVETGEDPDNGSNYTVYKVLFQVLCIISQSFNKKSK